MSCGVGHRHSSDLTLLWLWCRPAATAPVRPLAWESPYGVGAALQKTKKKRGVVIKMLIELRKIIDRNADHCNKELETVKKNPSKSDNLIA